jgi:hypothetical protein
MIFPTGNLAEVMARYNARGIFFVDTTYLLRLRELATSNYECQSDFLQVREQLRNLVQAGHYVFPHVHPHWLDAIYLPNRNEWELSNTSKYRFNKISDQEREYTFTGSVNLLNEMVGDLPGVQIDSFRAGGWCIQPFGDFIPYFKKNKIRNEFTVLKGFYQFTDAQYFDFSNASQKNIYRFSDDINIEDKQGEFRQYAISSIYIPSYVSLLEKVLVRILHKVFNDHAYTRGQGQAPRELTGVRPQSQEGKDLMNSRYERIAVELLTSVKLGTYLKYLKDHDYMHFISHPKMITGHNLKTFDRFLEKTFRNYDVETDFRNMSDDN